MSLQRLTTKEVAEVLQKGRAVHSGSFLLRSYKYGSIGPSKSAFIAPKKVFKSAVLRNKAKRRGRAAFIQIKQKNGLKQGFYLVFMLRSAAITGDFADFKAEIEQILIKQGILGATNI